MTTEIYGKNKGEIVEQLAEKFGVGTTTIYARFKKLNVHSCLFLFYFKRHEKIR